MNKATFPRWPVVVGRVTDLRGHLCSGTGLNLDFVTRPENDGDQRQTNGDKPRDHAQTQCQADIGDVVKAPAQGVDQIDHWIEQRQRLPEGWQHLN